jgi:isopentenyl-diphosphate delta-isomerase
MFSEGRDRDSGCEQQRVRCCKRGFREQGMRTSTGIHKIFRYSRLIGAASSLNMRGDSRKGGTVSTNPGMIVDVVDEENKVVSNAERWALLANGLNFRTVLFNDEGQLVLQRLSSQHPRSPERLGSSVAGYLYAHESYFEAAKRKLRDELRVTARIRSIGEFQMLDRTSRKFVRVFIGTLRKKPVIADDLITELVYIFPTNVSMVLSRNPSLFTPTFVLVYELFKRWKQSH